MTTLLQSSRVQVRVFRGETGEEAGARARSDGGSWLELGSLAPLFLEDGRPMVHRFGRLLVFNLFLGEY